MAETESHHRPRTGILSGISFKLISLSKLLSSYMGIPAVQAMTLR